MIEILAYYYLIGVALVAAHLIRGMASQIVDMIREETPPTPPALLPLLALILVAGTLCALAIMAALWPWGVYDEIQKARGKL